MARNQSAIKLGFLVLLTALLAGIGIARAYTVCVEGDNCTTCAFYDDQGGFHGYLHWCRPAA